MLEQLLYALVSLISEVHSRIMMLNDSYESSFTDKELHFLVIGGLGILLIFLVYPIFRWLAESGHTMVIAWIYVFTVIVVITFAIEIGQGGDGNRADGNGRHRCRDLWIPRRICDILCHPRYISRDCTLAIG